MSHLHIDSPALSKSTPTKSLQQCPYLSTIRKNLLDFDFEKICSISLSHTNIYACLVCGRYFQGKSSTSPAYQHSIQFSHFVFINLQNSKIYCLPDDYEVQSYTLKDIQFNLNPVFEQGLLSKLEKMDEVYYNIDGRQFMPGVIGVNNLGKTDFATSVLYLINNVSQIRKFLVTHSVFTSTFLSQISILLRKIWNPDNFKGLVSPHEFLQEVSKISDKKFKIGSQSDPGIFFLWLKDLIQKELKKQKLKSKFQIQKLFKGKLKTSIIKGIKDSYDYEDVPSKVSQIPFSMLKLQFPEKGIFNKTQSQIPLESLLQKYIGKVGQKHEQGLRYAKIIEFPSYLIILFKRFSNNGYSIQKDNSQLIYSSKLTLTSNNTKAHYNLVNQIGHTGDYETGKYKTLTFFDQAKKWFEIEDLDVREVIQKQVLLVQPYMQMYKLAKVVTDSKNIV